jgi:hypothetical protein
MDGNRSGCLGVVHVGLYVIALLLDDPCMQTLRRNEMTMRQRRKQFWVDHISMYTTHNGWLHSYYFQRKTK